MPKHPGVYGPYAHRQQFRIHVVDDRGKTNYFCYPTEKEARQVRLSLLREMGLKENITLENALDCYETFLRDDKGNKPKSRADTSWRLHVFFQIDRDEPAAEEKKQLPVASVTEAMAGGLYEALTKRVSSRTGKPLAVDSHRNILAETKTFLDWCVARRWLRSNPLEKVEGKGRRKHGKPQLRIDEARAWMDYAIYRADRGEHGAVAAMMSLLMGLRASEIVSRVVRDVDDNGRVLWIPASKTEAGRRTLEVPELLRPYLVAATKDRIALAPLFVSKKGGHHDRNWVRAHVRELCDRASVMPVCAHGMRGLHSTLALERGVTPHVVAASLGHESPTTTFTSYASPTAITRAHQARVLTVLSSRKGND